MSLLLSCAKKEPADILVKKNGTWDFSAEHFYLGTHTGTTAGEITFESNGTGTITSDTGNAAISWAATHLTVTIEYYPKQYIHYFIKVASAKKIVLEDNYPPFKSLLTLSRK